VDEQPVDSEHRIADNLGAHAPPAKGNSDKTTEGHGSQGEGTSRRGHGGPRTPAGKARASSNARRHGILSPDPSAGGESPEDYEALLAGIGAHFQPVGIYEEEVVANIVNEFWALHRIARATSALIDLRTERIEQPPRVSFTKPMVNRTCWSAYNRPLETYVELEVLDTYADSLVLGPEIVSDVMRATEEAGFTVPMVDQGSLAPDSVGFVRHFFSLTALANGVDSSRVIKKVCAELNTAFDLACGAEDKMRRSQIERAKRAKRAATSHLPDLDDYERLVRYKRAHERSLEKWVAALEASQRARSGDLDPPIRVHISER